MTDNDVYTLGVLVYLAIVSLVAGITEDWDGFIFKIILCVSSWIGVVIVGFSSLGSLINWYRFKE